MYQRVNSAEFSGIILTNLSERSMFMVNQPFLGETRWNPFTKDILVTLPGALSGARYSFLLIISYRINVLQFCSVMQSHRQCAENSAYKSFYEAK